MPNLQKPKLLILGAGGFGQSIAELASSLKLWSEIYFVDDCWPNIDQVGDYKVISNILNLKDKNFDNVQGIVAVGNNELRKQWMRIIDLLNIPLVSIIHPSVILSESAEIAMGTTAMAGCIIGSKVKIERGVILNLGTLIDHDVEIGEYSHLSIGVKVTGGKKIEPLTMIKAGTIVS